ncbi:hypothetical protein D3C71_1605710 [compost metagenome]
MGSDADVAAAGDLDARAHAGACDMRDDGHITLQHGVQAAPDVPLMKVAQRGGVKTERGVFGDIAPSAERPALAFDQHAAHIGAALDAVKHLAQLAPHGARHGVQTPGVAQGDPHHTGVTRLPCGACRHHFSDHLSVQFCA